MPIRKPAFDVVYMPLGAAAFGGAERSLLDLACETSRLGRRVLILAEEPLRNTPFPDVAATNGVEVRWVEWSPRRSLFWNVRSAVGQLRKIDAQVVHFNISWRAGMWIIPVVARVLTKARIVGSMRAMPEPYDPASKARYFGIVPSLQVWRWPDLFRGHVWARTLHAAVSVNANDFPEQMRSRFGFPAAKLHVIYNGVVVPGEATSPPVIATARATAGIATSEFAACYVGRLSSEKGVHCLLQALARLSPGIKLVIVGDGPMKRDLEDLSGRLGLEDRIRFLGFQADPYPFIAASDAVVVPSLWEEAFGRVVAEAMMLGVPVIASEVGGMGELFVDGEHGRYVPPGDVPRLASAIEELASDPALRKAMGRQAKALATQRYSLSRVVEQYHAVYVPGSAVPARSLA